MAASAAAIPAAAGLQAVGRKSGSGPLTGHEKKMDDLEQLSTKLQRAFESRLVSVILYGSGASAHDDDPFSDLNVLAVLKQVTTRELEDGEPAVRWWRGLNHPSPLFLSEEETSHSADSFPIEFRDMKDQRKVLYGVDVIADLRVETHNYRVQVEHELRAKMIRLRQHAAHVLSDPAALLTLCLNSVSTFCVLGRHALLVAGHAVPSERRPVIQKLAEVLRADMSPMSRLVEIRAQKDAHPSVSGEGASALFAGYLECVRQIVEFVDRLE